MKIYTHLQLGEFHPTFCEDFLFHTAIDEQFYLAAVMDGCSTAKDSHFASTLFAKILSKLVRLLPYQQGFKKSIDLENTTIKDLAQLLLEQFFKELEQIKNALLLDTEELLSTLILLLFDQYNQETLIIALGDGVIAIDGEIIEIEQDNRPAYPAFFLGKSQDFANLKAPNFYKKNIHDVSIASDGVTSFLPINHILEKPKMKPLDYLLVDTSFREQENMLHKKCLILEQEYGLKASDDLSIIRIFF